MTDGPIPITAQVSPADGRVCAFTVGRPLYPGGSFNCASADLAKGSPLLEALFRIAGVAQVWVAEDRLTVQKDTDAPWPELGKKIAEAVRAVIRSGVRSLVAPEKIPPSTVEEHIRRQARLVLERDINPSLASHGGAAEVVDVKGTEVYVRFSGGCQGCSSSSATLKQGIERALLGQVPQATAIIDATDHAAGKTPYYVPGRPGQSPLGV